MQIQSPRGEEPRCGDAAPPPRTSPGLTLPVLSHVALTWISWTVLEAVLTLHQVVAATLVHE